MTQVLIVAAEASSALYAKRLLQLWKSQERNIQAFGIGSREMEAEGFEIVARSEDLAVVGIQEVIAHWGEIKGAFHGLLRAAQSRQPKVALLLDYPDFNLRLAKKLKGLGIPVVYYISPQLWAWRSSRVKTVKSFVDKMLVLFPFEVDFYRRHGVEVEFVGHPLLDELDERYFSEEDFHFRRSRYGIRPGDKLLGLMPGSRKSELKHHLQVQLETARQLVQEQPRLKVALLVAPGLDMEFVRSLLPDRLTYSLILTQAEPFDMIHLCDALVCASGTATLMVGLMQKPMVVMYKMNPLSAFLAKRFVRSTQHFAMVNLILNDRVVPELFQEQAEPEKLASELKPQLFDEVRASRLKSQLGALRGALGEQGATQRVDRALDPYLREADVGVELR